MLKAFHSNRSLILLLLPVIVVGFFLLNYNTGYHKSDTILKLGLWGGYSMPFNFGTSIFTMILTVSGGILLNALYNRNGFTERNNYLPALVYVVFLSFFHSYYFLDGLAIAQFFILLAVMQLFKLKQKEDGRRAVFNAAIFFGISCTFFPVLFLGTPILFFLVWISRPFLFRESMLALTGLLIPLLYASLYSYFFGVKIGLDDLNSSSKEIFLIDMWIVIFSTTLFFLFALKLVLYKIKVSSIRLKKIFRLLLLLTILLFSLFLIDVLTYKKLQVLSLLFIPLSMILPYAFGEKKPSIAPSILFYIVLTFAVSKFFISFNDLAF